MRPFLREVIDQLLQRHAETARVDLNDIDEVIGLRAVSYEDVELVIQELEARGCSVGGEPTVREMDLLRHVLAAARRLRQELGRAPTSEEVAEAAKKPLYVVRRALENARAFAGA
ncbi:MAG: hypothetical protein KC731_13285 [Myxococcales bacterium]|nr:hypothetical protein [Myxococcales bacterium]